MKRILSILFIATATCSLTVFPIVPHHHHGATICTADAHCQHDNMPVRNHTDSDTTHCTTCPTVSETVVTTTQSSVRHKLQDGNHPFQLIAVPSTTTITFAASFNQATGRLYAPLVPILPLYRPANTDGLRAPPTNV
ncbi:MAG: hypothetical protein LBD91_07925 [Prevotellaceae bacterium]|jgi:hypothetical protein|nr:hypothetical protein [Prevotellaceae bacterium]